MLLYNTTYHVEQEVIANFLIWLREMYMEDVRKNGLLKNPRLCRVLSHREEGSESYSLQWEVESSGTLHRWHAEQGAAFNEQIVKTFGDKVIGIPTLLEVLE